MDKMCVDMKNDLKFQRHLVEVGEVFLNQSNCEPKRSLIYHQPEKKDSEAWKIFILEVEGIRLYLMIE